MTPRLLLSALAGICLTIPAATCAQVVLWHALTDLPRADMWSAAPCDSSLGFPRTSATDAAGNTVVTGCTYSGSTNTLLTVKYDPNGQILWSTRNAAPARSGDGRAVAIDAAGDVYVSGRVFGRDLDWDIFTVKYAGATGELIWEHLWTGGIADDLPYDLVLDAAGGVYVAGTIDSSNSSVGVGRLLTIKIDGASGAELWTYVYNGGQAETFSRPVLAIDHAGDLVLGAAGRISEEYHFISVKLAASDGALLWESQYSVGGNFQVSVDAVVVDSAGDVLVAGQYSGIGYDFAVIKYDGADGSEHWAITEAGPDGTPQSRPVIAVDGSGDVALGGSVGSTGMEDFLIQKRAGSSGDLLWSRQHDGGVAGADLVRALIFDASDDLLVSGTASDASGVSEIMTLKLNGADGSEAWTSHYRSAAENGDTVAWMGLDGAGNPLLVGTSDYSSGGRSDFAVVKLDGDAGTTLWVADEGVVETHTTFGCAGPYSEQRAVAVDDQGNTFVAGCEYNSTGYDYLTGKLDAGGNWLWRTRYDGGASDRVVALALDSEGNVLVTGGSYGDIQTRTDY